MNKETEIRFEVDKDFATQFKSKFDLKKKYQKDTYYKGNFDGVLRIRMLKDRQELAYKCMNKGEGWSEIETEIKCADVLVEIFSRIGLKELLTIEKDRLSTKFHFQDKVIEVNLDDVKGLGLFCELELINGEYSTLEKASAELGLSRFTIIKKGYVSLMLEKKNN